MARIVIQALHSDGEPRRWTLSERIVAENLDSDHYVTQLVERLGWATADAEALESPSVPWASTIGLGGLAFAASGQVLRSRLSQRGPQRSEPERTAARR